MSIDRNQLTKYQQTVYDNWLKVPGHTGEDSELIDLLGFIKQPKTRVRHAQFERHENIRREAELVVKHLERGLVPELKECKWCKSKFAADYKYMAHCSDDCLRATLENMGLRWDPSKSPAERWQTPQIPSTISPQAMEVLMPVFEANAAVAVVHGAMPVIENLDDPFADI